MIEQIQMESARAVPIDTLIELVGGKTRCLWHDEKSPSLTHDRRRNRLHCFGCGVDIDPIGLMMHLRGCTMPLAVEALTGGGHVQKFKPLPVQSREQSHVTPRNFEIYSALIFEILNPSSRHYDEQQPQEPIFAYLQSRGLDPAQAWDTFRVAWIDNPQSVFEQLKRRFSIEELKAAGLIKERKGKDAFLYWQTMALFPCFDQSGQVIYLEGHFPKGNRPTFDGRELKSLALAGIPKPLWGLDRVAKTDTAAITEGVIDGMSMAQILNADEVAAAMGSQSFQVEHVQQLAHLKKLLVFGDRDRAGANFQNKVHAMFKQHAPHVKIELRAYPEFVNDANDLISRKEIAYAD